MPLISVNKSPGNGIRDTLPSAPAVMLPTTKALGAVRNAMVVCLGCEYLRWRPVERTGVGQVAHSESCKRRWPVDQQRAQRENHEFRWIVSRVDDQSLGVRRLLDVIGHLARIR